MNKLVETASHAFLNKVGFVVEEITSSTHPLALASRFRNFYNALITSGVGSNLVDSLATRDLRAAARTAIGLRVATAYEELYASVQHMPSVAAHSPDEVRALLDV